MIFLVKNKSGFVGVGAYGGNQVRPFYKESYPSLFINTALTDLKSLTDVEEEYKYHVPGSEGCNKDRKKSKELFRQEIDNIINEIKEKMSGIEYLFIVASAGGGCGSGVLAALKQVAMEEMDLKACIIITVLPDTKTESIKALINSYETLAEIEQLNEYAGATFILDNDKSTNKMRINEMFFCYLDSLLTSENSSTYGNVDDAEIEQLLSTTGAAIISKLGKDKSDTQNLINTFHNNVYAPIEDDKVIKYIGLIQPDKGKNIRIESICAEVGTPLDCYLGYEADSTLCVLTGLSLPYTKMQEIKAQIDASKDTIKRNLSAQSGNRMESLGFFDDIPVKEKSREKKKSNRDLLF